MSNGRQRLEEGPITDPAFVDHYWRRARRPARWAARWIAAKLRTHGVRDSARVLDIGCGPAWVGRYLADRFPRMTFIGLDMAEPMIRRAREGFAGGPVPANLALLVGDGCRLPFPNDSIDAVLSGATLHHISEPVRLFDEVDRVLAPDGCVMISDLNRGASLWVRPLVWLADRIERRLRPPETREIEESIGNSFNAAFTQAELREMLDESTLGRRVACYRRPLVHWIQTPVPRDDNGRLGGMNKRDE